MTDGQVKERADKYHKTFGKAGVREAACDPDMRGPNAQQMAAHAMWMCRQVPRLCVEGDGPKAREWIRFVEGVLWSGGMMSFVEMTSDGASPQILTG